MFKAIAKWLLRKELSVLLSTITTQEKELSVKVATPPPVVVGRIMRSEFLRFKNTLPLQVVTGTTTQLQAASLVGQQYVLDKIEQELVSDR